MGFLGKLFGGGKRASNDDQATVTYRVGINETCRTLARRFYGDEAPWERIYRDNQRVLGREVQTGNDPLLPGTEVTIRGAKYDLSGQPIGPVDARSVPAP